MGDHRQHPLAGLDARIAKPGDPDLDFHLTGLRIAELVVLPTGALTEITVTFGTSAAAGYWIDPPTGERFYPDTVSSVTLAAGFEMRPGSRWLLDVMTERAEAWRASRSPVTVTMAPGKWSLLYCPGHLAGTIVPVPRGGGHRPVRAGRG